MICDEALDLRNVHNIYMAMVNNLSEEKEIKKFNKCLVDSFTKLFSRMFCDGNKEHNYQAVVYYGMYIAKCTTEKNVKHTTCEFFKAMLEDQKFVQFLIGHLCYIQQPDANELKHSISKRQYSLQSMIYLFKDVSCDISETLQNILVAAQTKFSYLNWDNPFRKYVDWNLINEILPQFLCCFADAMDQHTRKHVTSASMSNIEISMSSVIIPASLTATIFSSIF